MTGSVAIDVVIGLVFVYLLYSLLASILQELITKWLGLRSRMLLRAVSRMLDDADDKKYGGRILNLFVELYRGFIFYFIDDFKDRPFAKKFYEHPVIKYLGESSYSSKPSYLNATNFSQVIVDMLRGAAYDGTQSQKDQIKSALDNNIENISPETLRQIRMLFVESKGDIEKFRALLEKWFNEVMERCSGWFKKQTQLTLFIIGLTIAIVFNVDTLAIYKILANDKNARQEMVNLAIASVPKYEKLVKQLNNDSNFLQTSDTLKKKDGKDSIITFTKTHFVPDSTLTNVQKAVMADIDQASNILALGWPDTDSCKAMRDLGRRQSCCHCHACTKDSTSPEKLKAKMEQYNKTYNCSPNPYQTAGWPRFFGWVLTALAISLGAPFWFDLLNKVVAIRSSIKPQAPVKPTDTDLHTGSNASSINRVG